MCSIYGIFVLETLSSKQSQYANERKLDENI